MREKLNLFANNSRIWIRPERFFVAAAIFFEILFLAVTPPFMAPDETNHFFRAYQVSEGQLVPIRRQNRVGGWIPDSFQGMHRLFLHSGSRWDWKARYSDIKEAFNVEHAGERRTFMDFPNTSYYSPVAYLPHAIAILLFRKANTSMGTLYYGTKLLVFVFWLFLMNGVIKLLPIGKWLFVFALLLPMNIYITNAFSADILTNCAAFLLIAMILKLSLTDNPFRRSDMFALVACGLVLVLTKFVYIPLLALLFMIPGSKFGSVTKRINYLLLILAPICIVGLLWASYINGSFISFKDYNPFYRGNATLYLYADYQMQKEHLLTHPAEIFMVPLRSIIMTPPFYFSSYVARLGVYMDLKLSWLIYILVLVTMMTLAAGDDSNLKLKSRQKILLFTSAILTFFMIVLSQHLTWNEVGKKLVDNLQGRYLTPVFPLLFLCLHGLRPIRSLFVPAILVITVTDVQAARMLHDRYFNMQGIRRIEFYCNAETTRGEYFGTTNSTFMLRKGAGNPSSPAHAGKFSIAIPPRDSACFVSVKRTGTSGLALISAYTNVPGAELVVSAGHPDSVLRYVRYGEPVYTDKGWTAIELALTLFEHEDNSRINFYIRNPTDKTVLADDIEIRVQ